MTLKPLTLTLLAAALAAPMTADAAPLRESKYDVTVEIKMTEDWKATEHLSSSCGPEGGRCDRGHGRRRQGRALPPHVDAQARERHDGRGDAGSR